MFSKSTTHGHKSNTRRSSADKSKKRRRSLKRKSQLENLESRHLFAGLAPTAVFSPNGILDLSADIRYRHEVQFTDVSGGIRMEWTSRNASGSTVFESDVLYRNLRQVNFTGGDLADVFVNDSRARSVVNAKGGDDTIVVRSGNNEIRGGHGDDRITVRGGADNSPFINDYIYGDAGDDVLTGGNGADLIDGGTGDDVLRGGSGNDHLYGRAGRDRLFGEQGNDRLIGGSGADILSGGSGRDQNVSDASDTIIREQEFSLPIRNYDPIVSVSNVQVSEPASGDTAFAEFQITLRNQNPYQSYTVSYTTDGNTAKAGNDYIAKSGQLFFPPTALVRAAPGVDLLTKTVRVPILADSRFDPGETFELVVTAVGIRESGTATILDTRPSTEAGATNVYPGDPDPIPPRPASITPPRVPLQIVGDVLRINASNEGDNAVVRSTGENLYSVSLQSAGESHSLEFSGSQVSRIDFDGGWGNDRFENHTNIPSNASGWQGNDVLIGGTGDDFFRGGAGNDTLKGREGDDTLNSDAGADWVHGGSGDDQISGGSGNDWISGGTGNDKVYGGHGDDLIYADHGNDLLYGQDGRDKLFGQHGENRLDGGNGNDELYGGKDRDHLYGQAGNDRLYGGDGDDQLRGGSGHDWMTGQAGNDRMSGDDGNDTLYGDIGNDRLYGNSGHDLLYGQIGNDYLHGGSGNDWVFGGAGNDEMHGRDGDDAMYGGKGNDYLAGNGGNDVLHGEAGNDVIKGGYGNDTLNGGHGQNTLYGNQGLDRFQVIYRFHQDNVLKDHHWWAGELVDWL